MIFKTLPSFILFLSPISCYLGQGMFQSYHRHFIIFIVINHSITIIIQGGPTLSQRNSTILIPPYSAATPWTLAPDLIFDLLQPEALPRILQPGTMSRALAGILEPNVIVVHVAQNAVAFLASCVAWYDHQ